MIKMKQETIIYPIEDSEMDIQKIYLSEIGQENVLTWKEEKELILKIKNGDEVAKNELLERNLRLVVSIAKKYTDRGLPFLDLVQEGNIGLMVALNKYDESKNCRFCTYAFYWISQKIERAIVNTGRNIRISYPFYQKLSAYKKMKNQFELKYNREATLEELSIQMNLPLEEIIQFEKNLLDAGSINVPIVEDEEAELEEFLPSLLPSTEEIVMNSTLQLDVQDLLNNCKLNERESEVLMLRYGFHNQDPKTLEEIAKIYGMSREGVRRIEAKAFKKIRISKYITDFVSYTSNPEYSLQMLELYRNEYKKEGEHRKSLKNIKK